LLNKIYDNCLGLPFNDFSLIPWLA